MLNTSKCSICNHEDQERLEALGQSAESGDISWRAAAREGGLTHSNGLRNHMEKHYYRPPTADEVALASLQEDIPAMVESLKRQARMAPPEMAPLYAVAARNLAGLEETKPSQQHLIQSLKAIQEMTGMKTEQYLMLEYAKHQFGIDPAEEQEALPSPYIDVDSTEDEQSSVLDGERPETSAFEEVDEEASLA